MCKFFLLKIFFICILFNCCARKEANQGIKCNLEEIKDDFDQIAVEVMGVPYLNDSIKFSDTLIVYNGQFVYDKTFNEPKLLKFSLLKNKKLVGYLAFQELNNDKRYNANIFVTNENIVINTFIKKANLSNNLFIYRVKIFGSEENEIANKFQSRSIGIKDVIANKNSKCLLYRLFEQKENYSNVELKMMLTKFSLELKQAKAYKILENYLNKKVDLEKIGYTTNFNWLDVSNKNHSFKEALNNKKYMLLVFWASWCGPCRAEIPMLKKFNSAYGKDVSIVSLSIDDNYNNWKKAVENEKMPWLNLSGLPKNKSAVKREYNISAVPTLILLDKNGKVIINNINELEDIKKYLDSYE